MIVAMAVAYLFGSASASVHLAFTTHAICAEHGELVHEHRGAHESSSVAPVPAESEVGGPSGSSPDRPREHEHCRISQHRPGDSDEAGRTDPVLSCAPRGELARWPSDVVAYCAIQQTSLAPKQSPPSA
jgi:hypothetical protein